MTGTVPPSTDRSEVLFLGGRSGAGKTSLALELHHLLALQEISHAVIEGDTLDLAYPAPWPHHLAERNLAAIWQNYRALGYHRLIYTNTVSVLQIEPLTAAMGDDPVVTAVLLTATDETARQRLEVREQGTALNAHLERSRQRAAELDQHAPAAVHRLRTDGEDLAALAQRLWQWVGWRAP